MFSEDWAMLSHQMNQRVRHERAEAESRRLARLAAAQSGQGLYWQLRWVMCGLGLRLVALGAKIEDRYLPPARSVDNRAR